MANTFKLKTKTGINGAALSTVYTVPPALLLPLSLLA